MPLPDIHRICVVLVSTRNPLNIGAAARAMSNFGVRNLRLVKPFEPGFREARSAVGAAATLQDARIFPSVAEAVADCTLVIGTTGGRDRHLDKSLRRIQDAAPLVEKETARGNVAILFGSEKRGLSNDDLSYCHWTMHIPTAPDHVSMNLGQAVAVSLYEITRAPALPELASQQSSSLSEQSSSLSQQSSSRLPASFQADASHHPLPIATEHNAALPSSEIATLLDSGNPELDHQRAAAPDNSRLATSEGSERLAASLLQALSISGYVKPGTDAAVEDRVRRLVRRMRLTSDDADLVQGMVKQILWKLRNGPAPH
jgi:TrmH family RNA methyltransferase